MPSDMISTLQGMVSEARTYYADPVLIVSPDNADLAALPDIETTLGCPVVVDARCPAGTMHVRSQGVPIE